MKNKFVGIAEVLFEMELQNIGNNKDFHWDFNNWTERYGESSKKFEPELVSNPQDVKELSELIQADFKAGMWIADKDGDIYDPDMIDQYGGFITKRLEICLANLTRVGTQLEIFA